MKSRYLIKKKGDKKSNSYLIYLALYERDDIQLISTGQRINKNQWDAKDRLPKDQQSEVYREIEKVKAAVNKAKLKLELEDNTVTPFSIKEEYLAIQEQKTITQRGIEQSAKANKKSIYSLAVNFCDNLYDVKESTRNTVRISINQFLQYLEKSGQKSLEKSQVNQDVINGYGKYLLSKMQGAGGRKKKLTAKKGLANTTYNKRMKHLGQFLRSLSLHIPIKLRKVRKRTILALTVSELRKLEKVDVTLHKDKLSHSYLQRAKDMFLLGCYTSLRISDLKRINPTNSAGGFVTLTTQKNNEVYRTPIVPQAKSILKKYGFKAPSISEQEVNRSIKKVCELAGIDTPIEWEFSQGGKDLTKIVPKYELVTSHIAGKTFITNAKELWDLEPTEVAAIVRKDLRTMLNHYFKAPVESATQKMLRNSGSLMKVAKDFAA